MSDSSHDRVRILFGEALTTLRTLESESVHCVVTSPPYWQLRDYGHPEQLGLEETPQLFVARLVEIFREVRRVLRSDGTCWVNLGDTYVGGKNGGVGASSLTSHRNHNAVRAAAQALGGTRHRHAPGVQAKGLVGVPWRCALALQDDGWILRSEIIWQKPSAMPESVRDRPSRDHEHLFLLTKTQRYWYDADAIRTPLKAKTLTAHGAPDRVAKDDDPLNRTSKIARDNPRRIAKLDDEGRLVGANARTVWSIAQEPWSGKHTSTFPRELARRCIVAGCPVNGIVLDPFVGTATTIEAALAAGRRGVGIELNEALATEQERRLSGVQLGIGGVA